MRAGGSPYFGEVSRQVALSIAFTDKGPSQAGWRLYALTSSFSARYSAYGPLKSSISQ
jgi:hypothetical protein